MDKNTFETKIKQIEEQMHNLILEKEEIILEKNDKIDELLLLSKRQEEERKKDREMMLRQEELLRSLGVHLEDVASQNNELLEKVEEQNDKLDVIQNKLDVAVEDRAPNLVNLIKGNASFLLNVTILNLLITL